jgi:hypothetical protein
MGALEEVTAPWDRDIRLWDFGPEQFLIHAATGEVQKIYGPSVEGGPWELVNVPDHGTLLLGPGSDADACVWCFQCMFKQRFDTAVVFAHALDHVLQTISHQCCEAVSIVPMFKHISEQTLVVSACNQRVSEQVDTFRTSVGNCL